MESAIWKMRKQKKIAEQQIETKNPKNEGSMSNLWEDFKYTNIRTMTVPGGEETEQAIENLCK